MNKIRILLAGAAATLFSIIFGAVTCGGVFNWVYTIEPTNVWKPLENDVPGIDYMLGLLLLTIVMAYIYALINKGIPGKNRYLKGLAFGVGVWAVGILPGMLATYSFMTVAPTVVIYWVLIELVKLPLVGLIISSIYKK